MILVYLGELRDLNLLSFCDLVPVGDGSQSHNPFFTVFFWDKSTRFTRFTITRGSSVLVGLAARSSIDLLSHSADPSNCSLSHILRGLEGLLSDSVSRI